MWGRKGGASSSPRRFFHACRETIAVTAIHPHHTAAPTPAAEVSLAGLTFWWDVLADAPGVQKALGSTAAGGGIERARVHMTLGEQGVTLTLECVSGTGSVTARTSLGAIESPVHVVTDSARGGGGGGGGRLVHVSVPGVVLGSVLIDARGGVRVWYARTPLLASLGFPAGSYDRPVAGWTI